MFQHLIRSLLCFSSDYVFQPILKGLPQMIIRNLLPKIFKIFCIVFTTHAIAGTSDELLSTGKELFNKGSYLKARTVLSNDSLANNQEASFYKLAMSDPFSTHPQTIITTLGVHPITDGAHDQENAVWDYINQQVAAKNPLAYLVKGLLNLQTGIENGVEATGISFLLRGAGDNKHAQYWLGLFSLRGNVLEEDQGAAVQYFRQASIKKHAAATGELMELGESFSTGLSRFNQCVSDCYEGTSTFCRLSKLPLKWISSVGTLTTTLLTSIAAGIGEADQSKKQAFIVAAAIVGGVSTFCAALSVVAEKAEADAKQEAAV